MKRRANRPAVEPLEDRQLLTTLVVTSVLDTIASDGVVTLREALTAAKSNLPSGDAPAGSPGLDVIHFKIPGSQLHTIKPLSALPTVEYGEPIVIDGYTQPGSSPNTLLAGNDAVLRVQLDGSLAGAGVHGLLIEAGDSTVRGLVINRFGGNGIHSRVEGNNKIFGNFIGTDATGSFDLGNTGHGIYLDYEGVIVGSPLPADRNVISGNKKDAISALSPMVSNVVVQGNYIGVDRQGLYALGNGGSGISLEGVKHLIGGEQPGAGNVISGNKAVGLNLGVAESVVQGNIVGADRTGLVDLGNAAGGIYLNYSTTTLVGGYTPAARNLASGNGGYGVSIAGFSSDNVVAGNYIGTDITGLAPMGNDAGGVSISDNSIRTVVGGLDVGASNVISGNGGDGVEISRIDLGNPNYIQRNLIGVGIDGKTPIGNADDGVSISQSNFQVVGGPHGRNVISANGGDGVEISDVNPFVTVTYRNTVSGNVIGLSLSGTEDLGNARNGVRIFIPVGQYFQNAVPGNIIGEPTLSGRNIISGNGENGVHISGPMAMFNLLQNNYVGTAASGVASASSNLSNNGDGVFIYNAPFTVVGGSSEQRNVISNNRGHGVRVSGDQSVIAGVQGNYIGVSADGNEKLGNKLGGVLVEDRAQKVQIFGGNVISSNGAFGIKATSGAHTGIVRGNRIGTDATGSKPLGNAGPGIILESRDNIIGGTAEGEGNVISANQSHGVVIRGGSATNNRVEGNRIGTQLDPAKALGNGGHGILIDTAEGNAIGGLTVAAGNVIAFNSGAGVALIGERVSRNPILSNSIHTNGGLGIDLGLDGPDQNDVLDADLGPNRRQNYPVIESVVSLGGSVLVTGKLNSLPNTTFTIQLFSSPKADPTNFGEGRTLIGTFDVTTDASGNANFKFNTAVAVPVGSFVTATATDKLLGNTSEFSKVRNVTNPTFATIARGIELARSILDRLFKARIA